MSKFWDHYEAAKPHIANAADDIRHKVVEEGWFSQTKGREVTDDIAKWQPSDKEPKNDNGEAIELTPMPADPPPHKHHALYESIWGQEALPEDTYGQAPAIEPPKPEQDPGLEPDL